MTDLRQAALEQQAEPVACKTLCELCVKRGYDFCANAAKTTPIICPPQQQAEPPPEWPLIKNILAVFGLDAISFVAKWQAAQQQAEPVVQAVIAGALFDFMGWLTTRKERLILSSTDNASPAVESITEFAKMRGLSLDDARVQDWNTTPPQRPWVGLTDEEILSTDPWEILRADPWMGTSDSNINPYQILLKVRTLEAKLKERNT